MTRRAIAFRAALAVLISCAVSCSDEASPQAPRGRPDLVLILTDDQRYDAIGCAGNPWLVTPNIDRLAQEGAYFENSFVVDPLCSPGRASILTGKYGSATGVLSNALSGDVLAAHATYPELLQRAGYETAFIGKWHMPNPGAQPYRGFDHWVSFEGQGRYIDQPLNVDGTSQHRKGHLADVLAEHAVEWLERPRSKPVCLIVSLKNTHFPYQPAPRHAGAFANAAIGIPDSASDPVESQPRYVREVRARPRMLRLPERAADLVHTIRLYYESVLSVDDVVGSVIGAFEKVGRLDSACIVMTSDNGLLLGEHGLVQKSRSYEESIRVPLVMRFPAEIRPGTRIGEPALNVDLAPTFLDLAGVAIPDSMHGSSLRALWSGRASGWRDATVHLEPPESGNAEPTALCLRTSRWKYVRYRPGTIEEVLFDLDHDRGERDDVAADPQNAVVLEAMRVRLRAEMQRLAMPTSWWDSFTPAGAPSSEE